MRQTAADRAAISILNVADETGGITQQRPAARNLRRALELPLAGGGAKAQDTVFGLCVIQLANTVQVDQMSRPNQTKIHQWHQALPACERAGLLAELEHEIQSFVEARGIVIGEGCRFHARILRSSLPIKPKRGYATW